MDVGYPVLVTVPRPPLLRRATGAAVLVAIALLTGCSGGVAVPELERPATTQDVLPTVVPTDAVRPDTVRVVGSHEEVDIFVARPPDDQPPGYCLIAVRHDDFIVGCSGLLLPLSVDAYGATYELVGTSRPATDSGIPVGESVVVYP